MSWFDRVLQALQGAAVIGERVERLSGEMSSLTAEMRDLDRRVAQLEGAFAILMAGRRGGGSELPRE